MPNPRLAPSLAALRAEVDGLWPARSKASDGWLGDAAHAKRQSDHNPDAEGWVHALDVTAAGIDTRALIGGILGDPRLHYVIFDRRIWSYRSLWLPLVYAGPNPHEAHVHVSVRLGLAARDSTARWLRITDPAVIALARHHSQEGPRG